MARQTVVIGCDHAGYGMKRHLIEFFQHCIPPVDVIDVGCDSRESTDYPIFAKAAAEIILKGDANFGVLICGTGMGMAMAANRFAGIRAVATNDIGIIKLAREHNNANILCLSSRIPPSIYQLQEGIRVFLGTEFSHAGRHMRRISMMDNDAFTDFPDPNDDVIDDPSDTVVGVAVNRLQGIFDNQ